MANKVNQNVAGKVIVMEGFGDERQRMVLVNSGSNAGFGAFTFTSGSAIFGRDLTGRFGGGNIRVDGWEVERVLSDEEAAPILEQAKA